jgi:hypothetical protein
MLVSSSFFYAWYRARTPRNPTWIQYLPDARLLNAADYEMRHSNVTNNERTLTDSSSNPVTFYAMGDGPYAVPKLENAFPNNSNALSRVPSFLFISETFTNDKRNAHSLNMIALQMTCWNIWMFQPLFYPVMRTGTVAMTNRSHGTSGLNAIFTFIATGQFRLT